MSDVLKYQGTLTEDDYAEVWRLQRSAHSGATPVRETGGWFAIAFAVMAIWSLVGGDAEGAAWWAVPVIPCAIWWWRCYPNPRKSWRETPELQQPYSGQVTPTALEGRLSGVDVRVPWQAFTTYRASSTAMVLIAGHMMIPLVRSFFETDEAWQEACRIIGGAVYVEPRSRAFSWSTIGLWLFIVILIILAWHFAQK